jgi:hypothetical protein
MCASSSRVRAESIGISVTRIVYELVTIGDRGESTSSECGRICVGVARSVSVRLCDHAENGMDPCHR